MAQKPETVFRAGKVIPFLKTLKRTAFFPIQQKSIRGTPDFLLCCMGRFVALELKINTGKLDALQLYNMEWVKRTNGVGLVARPDNWELVKAALLKLDAGEIP